MTSQFSENFFKEIYLNIARINFVACVSQFSDGRHRPKRGGLATVYFNGGHAMKILHPRYLMAFDLQQGEYDIMRQLRESSYEHMPELRGFLGFGFLKSIKMQNLTAFTDFYGVIGKKYSEQKLQQIASNLCDAVKKLHLLGIAHLDLKSDNIFVGIGTLNIKLIDFNKAQRLQGLSRTHSVVHLYAPRLMDAQTTEDFAAAKFLDIFAAAVSLYELFNDQRITGEPFSAKEVLAERYEELITARMQQIREGCHGCGGPWSAVCSELALAFCFNSQNGCS